MPYRPLARKGKAKLGCTPHNRHLAQHNSSQRCKAVLSCKFQRPHCAEAEHRSGECSSLQQAIAALQKMGEKMGPNTLAAFHAGADFMQAKLAAEEDESSDDEALLAGAPWSPTARRAWPN